jgi:hypothetical protein
MYRRPSHRSRRVATVVVTSLLPLWLAASLSGTARAAPAAGTPTSPPDVPGSSPYVPHAVQSYAGPAHGGVTSPVADLHRPRHRLWFHDGAWWALMVGAEDHAVRVHELMPDHSWRPTEAVVGSQPGSVGDALSAGERLFVLAPGGDGVLRVARMAYDAAARLYRMEPGFPETVTRAPAPRAALTMDAEGHLWAAWTSDERVWVSHSDAEGRAWSRPFPPTADLLTAATDETAAVAAVDDGVAVMWSDQGDHQLRFALHRPGDPPDQWAVETPLGGVGMVDDHVSLSVVPGESGDTVVAVVKTSQNDVGAPPDAPLVMVLVRRPDGSWTTSVASTVADRVTRPVVLVDAGSQRVHLFLQSPDDGGTISHKSSPLKDLSFPEGRGDPWISGPDARDVTALAG